MPVNAEILYRIVHIIRWNRGNFKLFFPGRGRKRACGIVSAASHFLQPVKEMSEKRIKERQKRNDRTEKPSCLDRSRIASRGSRKRRKEILLALFLDEC